MGRIDIGSIQDAVAYQTDAAIFTRQTVNAAVEWLMAVSCSLCESVALRGQLAVGSKVAGMNSGV